MTAVVTCVQAHTLKLRDDVCPLGVQIDKVMLSIIAATIVCATVPPDNEVRPVA